VAVAVTRWPRLHRIQPSNDSFKRVQSRKVLWPLLLEGVASDRYCRTAGPGERPAPSWPRDLVVSLLEPPLSATCRTAEAPRTASSGASR